MEEKNNFRGLELLFKLVQNSLQSREDCLVAAVHIIMINKGNKCVGIGDDWPTNSSSSSSELLPESWNSNQEVYTLRYSSSSSGIRYLMKVVKAGNTLLINLFNVNEEKAAGMSVSIDNYICETFNGFDSTYKDLDQLGRAFQLEIVAKVRPKSSQSSNESTSKGTSESRSSQHEEHDPFIVEDYTNPLSFRDPQRVAFPSVGRGDLDPLGGGYGGGMLVDPGSLMQPSHPRIGGPPGLPRGAVPPGARFDPFGPPIGGGRGGSYMPNPDHLPPPGFDDDFI